MNGFDLSGTIGWKNWFKSRALDVKSVAKKGWNYTSKAWNSKTGQKLVHTGVNIAIGITAAAGAAVCVASIACGATVMIVGATAIVGVGTATHYALSSKENRQQGVGRWAGESLRSTFIGGACGTVFQMTCGRAALSVAESAWKYYKYTK